MISLSPNARGLLLHRSELKQPRLYLTLFQTYTRRKTSKEHVEQSEGVQLRLNVPEDNKEVKETTKMALPQFEREKRNYTPGELFISSRSVCLIVTTTTNN